MAIYRGQSSNTQKIQQISTLNVTTMDEAVAFLRAISNVNTQIASIVQREQTAMRLLRQSKNTEPTPEPVQEEVKVVEPVAETVNFEEVEEHTDTQKASRVARLKKAVKKTEE